jgi:hypothetical protein
MLALEVGDELGVQLGPETFSPVKYNTFVVGPISAKTKVREGETGEQAWQRLHRFCDELFEVEFQITSKRYVDRLKELGALIENHKVA